MKRLNIRPKLYTGSELFHINPRLKPPRFDLRKRKNLEDKDLEEDIDLKDENDVGSDINED